MLKKVSLILLSILPFFVFIEKSAYFNFKDIFVFVYLIAFMFAFLFFGNKIKLRFDSLDYLILIGCTYFLFNYIFNEKFESSFVRMIVLVCALFSIIFVRRINFNEKQKKCLTNMYILFGGILSVYFFFTKVPVFGDHSRYTILSLVSSTQIDVNYFAAMFLLPIVLAFNDFFETSSKTKKVYDVLIAFMGMISINLTGSRSTLVAILLSLMYLTIFKFRKRVNWAAICSVFLIFVFYLGFNFEKFSRFLDISSYFDASNSLRIGAWNSSLKIFFTNPLFGRGFNSTYWLMTQYGHTSMMSVHNMYLEILAETGLVGVGVILGMIIYLAKSNNKLVVALMISTFFTSFIISAQISAYYWINILFMFTLVDCKTDKLVIYEGRIENEKKYIVNNA